MGGHQTLHERDRSSGRRRRRRFGGAMAAAAVVAGLGLASGPAGAQTDDSADQISLVHAIPGVEVDLSLDGEEFATDFRLGEVRDITDFAGRSLAGLTAVRAGTEQPLGPIAASSVPTEAPASVVVHLDETLSILVTSFDDRAPTPLPPPGNGLLTVRHVAAAPAVDVLLQQTGQTVSLAPTGGADLVVPTGPLGPATLQRDGESLLVLPDITIAEGQRTIVYVSGTAGEGSLFTTLDSLVVGTAAEAPDTATADGPTDDPADQDSAGPVTQQSDDGTPQPTLVNTGVLPVAGESGPLLGFGVALLAAAALLFGVRRRLT